MYLHNKIFERKTYLNTTHPRLYFKYEFFDSDITIKDNIGYSERMTVGFNYFVNDKVRFQVNYLANIETVQNVDNDALIAQVQVRF